MTTRQQLQPHQKRDPHREKQLVALSSVGAALGLTAMKLLVGLLTGSLGILAEAAHSGLDLIAALMTLYAVRVSSRPADDTHHYGHEKFENLSAFLEALLLLATAGWVIGEAIRRLLTHEGHVEMSLWAFLVMGISILVDVIRSRVLLRVARRVGSQALEADALHFSTDIWSSAVVIAGLLVVWLTNLWHLPSWLTQADAVAALGVSCIVLWVSMRLARETLDALLDKAPKRFLAPLVERIQQLADVLEVRRVRLRQAGNTYFLEMTLALARTLTFEQTHHVTEHVEALAKDVIQAQEAQANVDVIIHVEPLAAPDETLGERLHRLAQLQGVFIHDIHVRKVHQGLEVDVDLEVPADMPLLQAHLQATAFEERVRAYESRVHRVTTHLEVPETTAVLCDEVTPDHPELVEAMQQIIANHMETRRAHDLHLYCTRNMPGHGTSRGAAADLPPLDVTFHLVFDPEMPVSQAHIKAEEMKRALRHHFPFLQTITLHMEPPEPEEDVAFAGQRFQ